MKRLVGIVIFIICFSCGKSERTHTETAQIVAESFISKDNESLRKYTTRESYSAFLSIQDMVTSSYSGETNFKVLRDTVYGDTAWVQFSISQEPKPDTFKLIKEDDIWKVTESGLKEKKPFK